MLSHIELTLPTRTRDLSFTRVHISITCLSVTTAGVIPCVVCTVLYVCTNCYNTILSVLISIYNLFLRVRWERSTTAHFRSGFLHTWSWMPSRFNMSWNDLFENSFPLSVCTQTGRLRGGFAYLRSLRTNWNADVTEGHVFDFRGTTCRYFEKTYNI